jgi:predicted DNA binding CopG/RHH family protein
MKKNPRGKFDKTKAIRLGPTELSSAEHAEAVRQIRISDEECRVSFRWGSSQVEVIKAVAEQMGVSYQQYIKQVVYRQALADLEQFGKSQSVIDSRLSNST